MTAAKAKALKLPELPNLDFEVSKLSQKAKKVKEEELMILLHQWEDVERQVKETMEVSAEKGLFDQAAVLRTEAEGLVQVQFTIKDKVAELRRLDRCMDIAEACRTKKLKANAAAKKILAHLEGRAKATVREVLRASQEQDHNEAINNMVTLWRYPEFRQGLEAILGITMVSPSGRRS